MHMQFRECVKWILEIKVVHHSRMFRMSDSFFPSQFPLLSLLD